MTELGKRPSRPQEQFVSDRESATHRRSSTTVVTALGGVLAVVVLGLFTAAQWTATTYSYSEKLFGTGLILGMGVPAAAGAVWLLHDVMSEATRG